MVRVFLLFLLVIVASWTYLDYWAYSALYHAHPGELPALVSGLGEAPAQYRVEVLNFAHLLVTHAHHHLGYRHLFALFDFVFALASGWLILQVLLNTRSFLEASPLSQWLRLFLVLGLTVFYLSWADWYQRPETLACTLYVAASVYLISIPMQRWLVLTGLVALSALQGFNRADEAMIFNFALFVYVAVRGARGMPAGRKVLLVASLVGGVAATLALWLLKYRIYPHATYGDTKVLQLLFNLGPVNTIAFVLFIVPVAYTLWRGVSGDGVSKGQGAGAFVRLPGLLLLLGPGRAPARSAHLHPIRFRAYAANGKCDGQPTA